MASSPVFAVTSNLCADNYTSNAMAYNGYAFRLHQKFGGAAQRWNRVLERLIKEKRPEELAQIHQIFETTEGRKWFGRQANRILFYRIDAVGRTLDKLYMQEFNLKKVKDWHALSLAERRALLLVSFGKWWWEVDSQHVMGLSRWTDFSYIFSRLITDPLAKGRLDYRIHELLGTSSQTGFFSDMFKNFRAEYRILRAVDHQPLSKKVLLKALSQRLDFLQAAKRSYSLTQVQAYMLNIYILKTAVLLRMLELGRNLTKAESLELVDSFGMSPSVLAQVQVGQFALSLVPSPEAWVEIIRRTAIALALAYFMGQFYSKKIEKVGHHQGDANDLFDMPPKEIQPALLENY